jgi:DNA polymerase III subunit epsilon
MSATKWADMPLLAFDIESTGIDTANDRIVQVALIKLQPGKRPETRTWLINPGVDIPAGAIEVHGITTEHATTHGVDPDTALFEVTGHLALWMGRGFPTVVYNGAFDLSMLEHENARQGVDTLVSRLGRGKVGPVFDVHVLDKHADPYRKGGRKLVDVCAHYGVIHTGAHDATADALATARLFGKVMAKHARKFPGMTIGALHQSQVGWRKTQMDGLRAYFDKNGIEHDGCDGGWPLYAAAARLQAVAA